MGVSVVHLGGSGPVLHAAASWLFTRATNGGRADLARTAVVLPGTRPGRRLLELLVEHADREGVALVPPRITTVTGLDELLLPPSPTQADRVTRTVAWAHVLRNGDPTRLAAIVRDRPVDDDWLGWIALADVFEALHVELAGHGLAFDDVAKRGAQLATFQDAPRWEAMAPLQREYFERLRTAGREEPQLRRARALASGAVRSDWDLVLVGIVELQPALRDLLAVTAANVTALVGAPDEFADRFDAWGCLLTEAWCSAALEVPDAKLEIVDRPVDQAAAAVAAVARVAGVRAPSDVVVGVPDERLVPFLEAQFATVKVPVRFAAGVPVEQTPPCRALAGIAEYLESRQFAELAALARQPDVEAWIRANEPEMAQSDWLSRLDRYAMNHLPGGLGGDLHGDDALAKTVGTIAGAIERLLAPLERTHASLPRHAEAIVKVLVTLYGSRTLRSSDPDDRLRIAACTALHDVVTRLQDLTGDLVPNLDAAQAVRIVLRTLRGQRVAPEPETPAIELLGWLELALDDAPALVLTGMNDGIVPAALNADPFLPNALRRHLGLLDNDRRYARDAYALSTLLAHRNALHMVMGRVNADGDPLAPSRLVFACEPEHVAARVTRFYRAPESPPRRPFRAHTPRTTTELPIPRPRRLRKPVEAMGVTWFRDYLACPYRFYLKRVLDLAVQNDAAAELDPSQFGTLTHDVLRAFGLDPMRGSTDANAIGRRLDALLDESCASRFGLQPGVAVRVQIEQVRERLHGFAGWQSRWSAAGWEIAAVELPLDARQGVAGTDGRVMPLRGRIDRIDVNARTGECALFDYKTSDDPRSPEQVHRRRGEWVDLQLPLYKLLLPEHPDLVDRMRTASPRVGFINLPNDPDALGERFAEWTDADLEAALGVARTVVDGVRAEVFWPPAVPAPAFSDAFSAICQDAQFVSDDALAEDD